MLPQNRFNQIKALPAGGETYKSPFPSRKLFESWPEELWSADYSTPRFESPGIAQGESIFGFAWKDIWKSRGNKGKFYRGTGTNEILSLAKEGSTRRQGSTETYFGEIPRESASYAFNEAEMYNKGFSPRNPLALYEYQDKNLIPYNQAMVLRTSTQAKNIGNVWLQRPRSAARSLTWYDKKGEYHALGFDFMRFPNIRTAAAAIEKMTDDPYTELLTQRASNLIRKEDILIARGPTAIRPHPTANLQAQREATSLKVRNQMREIQKAGLGDWRNSSAMPKTHPALPAPKKGISKVIRDISEKGRGLKKALLSEENSLVMKMLTRIR